MKQVYLFAKDEQEFLKIFLPLQKRLQGNVMLWVSWYKKAQAFKEILQKTGSEILL